jgi:RNA polymerase sigma factor (sigma-70 family)
MTPAEQRLEQLARCHGPQVLAYLARRVTPHEDAAEIFQSVLTTTWRKIHKVPESDAAALCWMLAVARRELANHRRGAARRHAATDRLRELVAIGGHPAYAADPAVDQVGWALEQLDAADREVVTLTYWDGLTSEQIGLVLEASPAAIRKRLERARTRIAVILSTAGETAGRERASVVTAD